MAYPVYGPAQRARSPGVRVVHKGAIRGAVLRDVCVWSAVSIWRLAIVELEDLRRKSCVWCCGRTHQPWTQLVDVVVW